MLKRVPVVCRVSFKNKAEADSTDTAFQGHTTPKLLLYLLRAPKSRAPQSRLRAQNLAATWSLVTREVPRPTVASARRSEHDSAAAVVGSDRTFAMNVEMAS